ncbi:MAG: NADH:ubiquinone reductase (Na(+)-transporting) subunit C [Crocinitomicaceae bacterium]|nr:NADH:ubiquinone reductase (Na(+)-transporting) subunit C [Crocinitomicaceae bacterium]
MAINKDSNGYTFGFAITMVVVVGAILAAVAIATKPFKDKNDEIKKQMNIVKALLPEEQKAEVNRTNAEEKFAQYVDLANAIVIDMNGDVREGVEAFNVDIRKENRDKNLTEAMKNYPMYIANIDGKTAYIIPVVGKGLWGPIWGNICLDEDMTTIIGATFDHKGETPGLGAEIKQAFFINGWVGEQITDENGDFRKFEIVKDKSGSTNEAKVDGITGGTITSKGVEEMVNRCLKPYVLYFKKLKS